MLGPTEIAIVAIIAVGLLFGPSLIPKFGKNLGEGIREFRKVGKELKKGMEEDNDSRGGEG